VEKASQHIPSNELSEGLSKTNALPSQEWRIAQRMPFLACRGQVVRALLVESLWDKLLWIFPLIIISVNLVDMDLKAISCFQVVLSNLCVLGERQP